MTPLSYFADTETPSSWNRLTTNDGMPSTPVETPDHLDLKDDDADS